MTAVKRKVSAARVAILVFAVIEAVGLAFVLWHG